MKLLMRRPAILIAESPPTELGTSMPGVSGVALKLDFPADRAMVRIGGPNGWGSAMWRRT